MEIQVKSLFLGIFFCIVFAIEPQGIFPRAAPGEITCYADLIFTLNNRYNCKLKLMVLTSTWFWVHPIIFVWSV